MNILEIHNTIARILNDVSNLWYLTDMRFRQSLQTLVSSLDSARKNKSKDIVVYGKIVDDAISLLEPVKLSKELPILYSIQNAFIEDSLKQVEVHFAGKTDLSIILGAGDTNEEYNTFSKYTFLLSNTKRFFERTRIQPNRPIYLCLDFNSPRFFQFLANLKGGFKEIRFDASVSKFCKWKFSDVSYIYDALQKDGKFYSETSMGISYVININSSKSNDEIYWSEYGKVQKKTLDVLAKDFPLISYFRLTRSPSGYLIMVSNNKAITKDSISNFKFVYPGLSIFYINDGVEYLKEDLNLLTRWLYRDMLKAFGFRDVQIGDIKMRDNEYYPFLCATK